MTARALAAAALAAAWAGAAVAQSLPLPRGASLTQTQSVPDGRYSLPVGPWSVKEGIPVKVIEGTVEETAWRVPPGLTPQQIIRPIREALRDAGWTIVLDCAAEQCGGFDFRFNTRVIPAPAMFVDLRDFRAVSALAPDGSGVSALASVDPGAGYLQIIRADTTEETPAVAVEASPAPDDAAGLITRLERDGRATLRDLDFASGDAGLGEGAVESLDLLAEYLNENPDRRVLLVGHTDATGSLEANRALSRQRALAAVDYLRSRHATTQGQIAAEGAGYLAPIASNLIEAGRQANRRIDAVLLPAE
ncbi:OmpA family protein [Citreimonas salinaria]|uniref:OmpA-OmpF porin, OOP family n=1 Tax=Citreimonas salinaria TaxID=321339 RepID=A0A1H3HUM5_9RHOB|nr:OmpA family protein [Citreimonas salinaria]SDY19183.1 OmpA-OmpF porin, OOP family [Citreimonas salinaria]